LVEREKSEEEDEQGVLKRAERDKLHHEVSFASLQELRELENKG
jgi:hypothetical protein